MAAFSFRVAKHVEDRGGIDRADPAAIDPRSKGSEQST
jgi:hypothetical protein